MAVRTISISELHDLLPAALIIDVRSPGEYRHAHIPGARSLPLFEDEERKVVGTIYKQQSREKAIKSGLDFFGVKMRRMVEETEKLLQEKKDEHTQLGLPQMRLNEIPVLVHCWRGGMRSAAVAWLLDVYGLNVLLLRGGYKVYRKWVRDQFEKPYSFRVIGGYTGSGKTNVLQELARLNQPLIDLEHLAHHKGSAFGALGLPEQPTQEFFENKLAEALDLQVKAGIPVWLEDESQRIGNLQIPMPLWYSIRKAPVYFLDVPFEVRLNYLTKEYGIHSKEKLLNAIVRIQKRLGGLETKNAVQFLLEDNHKECFRILLRYYDKLYLKGLHNRDNTDAQLTTIACATVNGSTNAQIILDEI